MPWTGFMAGFGQGFVEGADRKLQRELWLGKSQKESMERFRKAQLSTMQTIIEGRRKEEEELKEHVRVIDAFEDRLGGLSSPEEREAYLNLLREDPEYSASLLETLKEFEDKDKGVRFEDETLLEFVDLIDQTLPDNMSRSEYAHEVAKRSVDMEAGIRKYDSLWAAAMSTQDEDDLLRIETEAALGWEPEGNLGIPDVDFSQINQSPSDVQSATDVLMETARSRYDALMQGIEEQVAREGGLEYIDPQTRALYEKYSGLRASLEDRPELILEYPEFTDQAYTETRKTIRGLDNMEPLQRYNPFHRPVREVPSTPEAPPAPAPGGVPSVSIPPEPTVASPGQPSPMVPPTAPVVQGPGTFTPPPDPVSPPVTPDFVMPEIPKKQQKTIWQMINPWAD